MSRRSRLKAAQIIRCINSGVSCVASSVLVAMILTERNRSGLASPYSRIIFAISIADILFSFTSLISPFASPKDNPDALFAIGSFKSCEVAGFFHIIGIVCLGYYTVFLLYYFLKRIKYKMTPKDFAQKEEKYFHAIFIILAYSMAILCLLSESINPHFHGSICVMGSYPEGCERFADSVPCERGSPTKTNLLNILGGMQIGTTFVALVVILYLFTRHVYQQECEFDIPARGIGQMNDGNHEGRRNAADDESNPDVINQEGDSGAEKKTFILTKQAFYQSILYVSSFLLVYSPIMVALMQILTGQHSSDFEWRFWLDALILPLGGVFNILIYTRPKVLKLKEQFPMLMKYELFIIVIMKGGETPSMADVRAALDMANEGIVGQEDDFLDGHQQNQEGNLLSYELDVSRESEFISSVYQPRFGRGV